KDSSSISVAKRKNRKRVRLEKAKIERKLDGIFRIYDDIEYGGIEVQSLFTQINSTERLNDGFKLGKSMHDMLAFLLIKEFLKLQVHQLSSPKGYVSILKRGEIYEIPTQAKKNNGFNNASISCLESKEEPENSTEDEFVQKLVNGSTTPPHTISFPWSFDT
ncbi:7584_t:CDS:2, partial [Scutellospora calospora]